MKEEHRAFEVTEVTIQDRYLLMRLSGDFTVDAGKRCVDQMVEACTTAKRTRVLLDCQHVTGSASTIDRLEMVQYSLITRGSIQRIAVVSEAESRKFDRFLESAAINRGIQLRVFANLETAADWLTR